MITFSSANVTDGNPLLKERTQTINSKIKLHILGVPMNKFGNWLIEVDVFCTPQLCIVFSCSNFV